MRLWTVSNKLHVSLGLVILLLVLSALGSLIWISRIESGLSKAIQVERPLEDLLLKMDMDIQETSDEVTKYLLDRNPADRKAAEEWCKKFQEDTAAFYKLTSGNLRLRAERLTVFSEQLPKRGNDVLSAVDRRAPMLAAFEGKVDATRRSLENMLASVPGGQEEKREILLDMVANLDKLDTAVEDYAYTPEPVHVQERQKAQEDFQAAVAKYQPLVSTAKERQALDQVKKEFADVEAGATQVFSATDEVNKKVDAFESVTGQIISYLHNDLQPLVLDEAVHAITGARESVRAAAIWLLIMVFTGTALGLVSAIAITRAIVNPLSKLIASAGEIGRGNLHHRISLETRDEFAELGAAFNKMAENLEVSQQDLERRTTELQEEIAERERTEEALRQSEQRYRQLTESLEETVKNKVAELQQAQSLAALGQVVAVVAHEIRNPLQNIYFAIEDLKEFIGDDPQKLDVLERIDLGVSQINTLVGELLQYSRPVTLNPAPVNVLQVIQQALRSTENKLQNIVVRLDLEREDRQITMDAEKIFRALTNIITNAANAMPEGGTLSVYTRYNEAEGKFVIGVSDTGEGMDTQTLARIREPFFTTKPYGTGLGIPIVEKLVAAHNGSVRIKSAVKEGTTVEIELPV